MDTCTLCTIILPMEGNASFQHFSQGLHFLLQKLLLLRLFVPVDLTSQLVCQDNLTLHFQSVYLLLQLMVLFLHCHIFLSQSSHNLCLFLQLVILLL